STKRDWPETSSDAQALLRGRSAGFQVRGTGNRPTPASVFGEANLLSATRQLTVNTPGSGFYGPGHASCGVSCKEWDMATQMANRRESDRVPMGVECAMPWVPVPSSESVQPPKAKSGVLRKLFFAIAALVLVIGVWQISKGLYLAR